MGGPGSGRWRGRGRETVESYRFLDINRLSMTGYLRPGLSSVYRWTDGNGVASIKLRAEAGRLHLSYCVCVDSEKWKDVGRDHPYRPGTLPARRQSHLFHLPWLSERP